MFSSSRWLCSPLHTTHLFLSYDLDMRQSYGVILVRGRTFTAAILCCSVCVLLLRLFRISRRNCLHRTKECFNSNQTLLPARVGGVAGRETSCYCRLMTMPAKPGKDCSGHIGAVFAVTEMLGDEWSTGPLMAVIPHCLTPLKAAAFSINC